MAFADASVVALALPDLYAEFDTSIVGVSWVLTTYALAVARDRGAGGARAPPGPPARPRRWRRRRVRRRLARRRRGHEPGDAHRRPCGPGRGRHTRPGRVAPSARRDRRCRATGAAVVGDGRRGRRCRRPGTRWCAHPALRLAGDLRRPGADRRCRTRRRQRPGGAGHAPGGRAARPARHELAQCRRRQHWFRPGVRRSRRRPVPRRAARRRGVGLQPDPERRHRQRAAARHARRPARAACSGTPARRRRRRPARHRPGGPGPAARRAGGSRRGRVLRVRRRVRPRPRGARRRRCPSRRSGRASQRGVRRRPPRRARARARRHRPGAVVEPRRRRRAGDARRHPHDAGDRAAAVRQVAGDLGAAHGDRGGAARPGARPRRRVRRARCGGRQRHGSST